jgi:hypothetical protein
MGSTNPKGSVFKRAVGWLEEPLRVAVFIAVMAIMVVAGWVVWRHFTHKNQAVPSSLGQRAANDEKLNSGTISSELARKDYASYQATQQVLTSGYLDAGDSTNALRIMNEVIKKVPADQLNSATYATMADIQKTIRNSAQEKKYLELYLEKIKAGGGDITDIVSSTQKEIDSL